MLPSCQGYSRRVSVALQVGRSVREVGAASLLNAFFSTVVARVEGGVRGAQVPALTRDLYAGTLSAAGAVAARAELLVVRRALADHPPADVVWDLDDPTARPPWGDAISPDITSLDDYFVTSDGRDLLDVLTAALDDGVAQDRPVEIVGL